MIDSIPTTPAPVRPFSTRRKRETENLTVLITLYRHAKDGYKTADAAKSPDRHEKFSRFLGLQLALDVMTNDTPLCPNPLYSLSFK